MEAWDTIPESKLADTMLECVLAFREDMRSASASTGVQSQDEWQWLLTAPQMAQRTMEWYNEGKIILTASEIAAIWKGPRTRAKLVLSKIPVRTDENPISFTRRLAVLKAETGPMDWGVRYEPVVKEILQDTLGCKILELGRIHHRSLKNLAASPDGLITEGPADLVGQLVEIKCPTTRVINDSIPFEYWCQMQIQMEVCGISNCQYVEVKFKEVPSDAVDPTKTQGWITLEVNHDTMEMRYVYHRTSTPPLTQDPYVSLETYMWELDHLRRITVCRDETWFEKIQPDLALFWNDVEAARAGTWDIPKPRVKKNAAAASPSTAEAEPEVSLQTCAIVND